MAVFAVLAGFVAALLGFFVASRRRDLALSPGPVALAAGALGLAAGAALAVAGAGWEAFLLAAGLAPLAAIDAERLVLPDELTLPLIAIGVVLGLIAGQGAERALGAGLGWGALRALALCWPKAGAMGAGDAKLLAAIGAFLGWAALPDVAFIGALGGVAFALLRHGRAAAGHEIPFGAALAGAALIVVIAGPILC